MHDPNQSSFAETIKLELQVAGLKQKLADAQARLLLDDESQAQSNTVIGEPSYGRRSWKGYAQELEQQLADAQARIKALEGLMHRATVTAVSAERIGEIRHVLGSCALEADATPTIADELDAYARQLEQQHAALTARCNELQNDCQWAHEEFKSYIEFRLADRFEGDDAMIQRALGQSALYARLTIWLNKQALATGGDEAENVALRKALSESYNIINNILTDSQLDTRTPCGQYIRDWANTVKALTTGVEGSK